MRLGAVAAILLTLGTAACSAGGETPAQAAGARGGGAAAVPVATAKVEQKSIPLALTVIGTAEASSNVAVRAQLTGSLTSVNFKEGDDVAKGQVLFTLDRRPLEGVLQQAEATLAARHGAGGPGEIHRGAVPGSAESRDRDEGAGRCRRARRPPRLKPRSSPTVPPSRTRRFNCSTRRSPRPFPAARAI